MQNINQLRSKVFSMKFHAIAFALITIFAACAHSEVMQQQDKQGDTVCQDGDFSHPTKEDGNDVGKKLYARGEYAGALTHFMSSGKHGNADAQNNVGLMYYQGKGIEQNFTKAFYWFSLAAKNGNSSAMNNLGFAYQRGQGVRKNAKKAYQWTWRSAHTVKANYSAINHLASLIELGIGVQKDDERAADMYAISANGGDLNAMNHLISMGSKTPGKLDATVESFKQKALSGILHYQDFLGSMYMYGQQVDIDYPEAVKWFTMASDQGSAYAQSNLGVIFLNGMGVKKDVDMAQKYLFLAAAQSDLDAIYNLGVMYRDSVNEPGSQKLAMAYFLRASKFGDAAATLNAGELYLQEGKFNQALSFLTAAVDSPAIKSEDRAEGLLVLAHMFSEAQGVQRSDFLAYALADQSGKQDGEAMKASLASGMSDKETGFAKHLAKNFNRDGGVGAMLEQYQIVLTP